MPKPLPIYMCVFVFVHTIHVRYVTCEVSGDEGALIHTIVLPTNARMVGVVPYISK